MVWRRVRRVRRVFPGLLRSIAPLAVAAVAACLAGCSSQFASLGGTIPAGPTVTFESIDGPPPELFRRLVTVLNDEAAAQKVAVVSRSAPATYRVRGYMSAVVEGNRNAFTWVWDVYDINKTRVLRISGEEAGSSGSRRRDAWATAGEQVLRGMSKTGMERIAAFLNSGEAVAFATGETPTVTPASLRSDTPEAAGIFRPFGAELLGDDTAIEPVAEPPPTPQRQPRPHKRPTSTAALPVVQSTALATDR